MIVIFWSTVYEAESTKLSCIYVCVTNTSGTQGIVGVREKRVLHTYYVCMY